MSMKCMRKERNSEDLFVKDLLGEAVFAQTSGILSVAWFLSLGSPKIPLRQVSPLGSHLGTALIYLNKEISETVSMASKIQYTLKLTIDSLKSHCFSGLSRSCAF